jgi:hypothetical protein
MVPVFYSSESSSAAVFRALAGFEVSGFHTVSEFRKALAGASIAVVVFPALPGPSELQWLQELVQDQSLRGWILVTEFSPKNVSRLFSLGLPLNVVWFLELEQTLRPMVGRLLASDPLAQLEARLEAAEGLDPGLRRALVEVCRLRRPLRTLGGLAKLAGLSRGQLRYRWQAGFAGTLTPREFMDQVFTVRIFHAREVLGSWEAVTRELKVDRKTVQRLRGRVPREYENCGHGPDPPPSHPGPGARSQTDLRVIKNHSSRLLSQNGPSRVTSSLS